jgi:alkylglycerol monooxygenase
VQAILGLPLGPFIAHTQLNLLYQYWIHTTLVGLAKMPPVAASVVTCIGLLCPQIGSLGPLEYIINTPSHHRMHHRYSTAVISVSS